MESEPIRKRQTKAGRLTKEQSEKEHLEEQFQNEQLEYAQVKQRINEEAKTVGNRRNFLTSLGLIGFGSMVSTTLFAENEISSRNFASAPSSILKVGPYLQAPGENSVTVRWLTNVPCHSWVEYGTEEHRLNKMTHSVHNGLIDANNLIHSIEIPFLRSDTKYYYRISSKEITDFQPYNIEFGGTYKSEVHSFRTFSSNSEKASFVVYNDIHERPHSYGALFSYIGEEDLDFIHLNGDMFDYLVDENQLAEKLLKPVGQLFSATIPFFFGCGNHETRGKFARQLPLYFNANSGNKYYFSFQQGPAYFVVLDSGEDKEDSADEYSGLVQFDQYREQQAEWLKKETQSPEFKNARYKIVFSHIPPYHSGDWHGTMHCRKLWGPILNEAGIDVLIAGHTHRHGVHPPEDDKHNYPILIGGGPKEGTRTIIKGVANQQGLNLQMFNDLGQLVGELNL